MNNKTQLLLSETKQQERAIRGYNLYINGNVKRLDSKTFRVISNKTSRLIEDFSDIGLVCKCEDMEYYLEYGFNGDRCKHIISVEFLLMEEQKNNI